MLWEPDQDQRVSAYVLLRTGKGETCSSHLQVICHKSLMTLALCNLGERGLNLARGSRVLPVTAGKPMKEYKAASHITPTVKRREKQMQAYSVASWLSLLLHVQAPKPGNDAGHFQAESLHRIRQSRQPPCVPLHTHQHGHKPT